MFLYQSDKKTTTVICIMELHTAMSFNHIFWHLFIFFLEQTEEEILNKKDNPLSCIMTMMNENFLKEIYYDKL